MRRPPCPRVEDCSLIFATGFHTAAVLSFEHLLVLVVAYLVGSIPTGYLVARARGVDIRKVGSGNIGATNVFRILGRGPGTFVLLMDAFKGFASVFWLAAWCSRLVGGEDSIALRIIATVGAILGHNYTCWLNFKGGKGIATSAGAFLALTPGPCGVALGAWVLVFVVSRYVSLASLAAAVALPVATWALDFPMSVRVLTALAGTLAIYRHRANIQRLLAGTESRVGGPRPAAPSPVKEGAE